AFRDALNWLIRKWNDFHIPEVKIMGVQVTPRIDFPDIPEIKGFADGGRVSGPGGPRDDQVPALLSDGEYVINAAATARYLPLLEALNAQRCADGGQVGRRPTPAARGGDGASLDDPSGVLLGVAGAAGLVAEAFDGAITDGAAPAWQSLVDQLGTISEGTVV